MILVITGTHEQPFDRLLAAVDRYAEKNGTKSECFIQSGYSKYEPRYAESASMLGVSQMEELADKANIIVTHGGPGSICLAFERDKVPIVVPRQSSFGEHVDDHQVEFTRYLEEQKRVIAVYETARLSEVLGHYDSFASECKLPSSRGQRNRQELTRRLDSYLFA